MKKNNMEYKTGQKVLVDTEPRTDQPAKWVEATYVRRFCYNVCFVKIEGILYAYPEKLVKKTYKGATE